ncbi:MAG: copper resistance protein CopC [Acidimicrobiia bacterium]
MIATNIRPKDIRRVGVVALLGVAFVIIAAGPASAHASLLESNPAPGEVLQTSPKSISLSFSEPVDASFDAIRVYDSDSKRVGAGEVKTRNNLVTLPLDELKNGSYAVTYRVSSSDSHPVTGAFTFQVGNAGNASSPRAQALAERLLGIESGDQAVGALYGFTRWLLFSGLALMIGCAAFGVIVSDRACASRANRRLVWIGWAMTTIATALGFFVYGAYAAGVGLGDMFKSTLINETLDVRYGEMGVARLALLLLAIPIIRALLARDGDEPRPISRPWLGAAALFAVLIAATPGLSGHASSGDLVELAVVTDTVHVLAMGLWVGGLVALAVVVLRRHATVAEMEQPVRRWSRLAFGCVAVLVATGAFQAWRQVGNLTALRSTEYGRMLIIKVLLFAGLLMLATFSREIVRFLYPAREPTGGRVPVVAGGSDDDLEPEPTKEEIAEYEAWESGRLRRSVWGEVGVAVVVLVVTALLVNAPPAKGAAALEAGNAVGITLKSSDVWVDIVVVPGRRGQNAVHVSALTPGGKPKDVEDLTITFALPEDDIAGIEVPLERISAGHYTAAGFSVPIAGKWQITAKAVVSEFTQRTMRTEIEIGDR